MIHKTYWMTGLPCSGKTTIANSIDNVIVLDGDDIRALTGNKDFSRNGRIRQMQTAARLALQYSHFGDVIVATISPIRLVRECIKASYNNIVEVYVKCSLEECIKRDVKGMYKKALGGEIKNFTGIDDPYEEPFNPDLILDTEKYSLEYCVSQLYYIIEHNKIYKG